MDAHIVIPVATPPRKPRLPRYQRVANHPPIRIGRREQLILEAVAKYSYLTATQITSLLYSPKSLTYVRGTAQGGLQGLFHAKFLRRLFLPTTTLHGAPPAIYALDGKGFAHLKAQGIEPKGKYRPSDEGQREESFLAHTLAANDFLVLCHGLAKQVESISIARELTERELKRGYPIYVEIGNDRVYVVNDGWLELMVGGAYQVGLALELDRGTVEKERFKRKVRGLVSYARGAYQEAFGTESLTVLFVTVAGKRRLDSITSWLEKELEALRAESQADMFRLAAFDPANADPEEIFFKPVWRRPFEETLLPLVEDWRK